MSMDNTTCRHTDKQKDVLQYCGFTLHCILSIGCGLLGQNQDTHVCQVVTVATL